METSLHKRMYNTIQGGQEKNKICLIRGHNKGLVGHRMRGKMKVVYGMTVLLMAGCRIKIIFAGVGTGHFDSVRYGIVLKLKAGCRMRNGCGIEQACCKR